MSKFSYYLIAVILILTGVFSTLINKSQLNANNTSIEFHFQNEVRNQANNYAMVAIKLLKEDSDIQNFVKSNVDNSNIDIDVTFERWEDNGSTLDYGIIKIQSEATTKYLGKDYKWIVEVDARNVPFSNYLVFTNTMGTTNFIGEQYIGGPVHVNNTLNLIRDKSGNDPTFTQHVTYNNSLFRYYNSYGQIRTGNINDFTGFQNGSESGVTISGPDNYFFDTSEPHYNNFIGDNLDLFPEFNDYYNSDQQFQDNINTLATKYTDYSDLSKNQNYNINSTKYIKINDNSIFVSPVPPGFWNYDEIKKEIPISTIEEAGGVFYTDGELHVEGQLNGKLTLACEKQLYIDGNVTYKDYDESNDNPFEYCEDILSLMTKEDIVISTSNKYFDESKSPSWNDPNENFNQSDLSIMSALYTQKGIHIQNWDYVKNIVGSRGKLNIIGSFITNEYGATGIYSNGQNYGYSKNFYYDPRFGYYAPYGMPETIVNENGINKKQRQILSWNESNSGI